MQYRSAAPSARRERPSRAARRADREPRSSSSVEPRSRAAVAEPCEVGPVGVEYLVRAARVTDIEQVVALSDASLRADRAGPHGSADLLRQLVYLPQADIVVAEARRVVVGGAILALRPSVRAGGYVGTVDLLVVDPSHAVNRLTEALLDELLRSARNKGCTVVEAAQPDDPDAQARWARMGFRPAGARLYRTVTAAGAASRTR